MLTDYLSVKARAMAGVFLLFGGICVALLAVASLNLYRRKFARPNHNLPSHRAAPTTTTNEAPTLNSSLPPPPTSAGTDSSRSSSLPSAAASLSAGAVASVSSLVGRNTMPKYDRLPLVPHMEDDEDNFEAARRSQFSI